MQTTDTTKAVEIADRRPALREVALSDKYTATSGTVFISGIEALVRLTLDQRRLDRARGLNTAAFVCGYEGSPLGGLDLELQRNASLLDEAGVVFTPGTNEELAATAVAGSQLLGQLPGRRHDGVAGFWFGKNPGLDRAADAIRHGNLSGTSPLGGAVAIVGDDPTCKSSTLPSSCEQMTRSLLVPLLTPSSVDEVLTLGLHAVALSRYAGTWVAMKIVADIADASATVELGEPASFIPAPDPGREMHEPLLVGPQSLDAERRLHSFRLLRVGEYVHHAGLNVVHFEPRRPRMAVVAPGLPFATVLRSLSDLGLSESDLDELGVRLVRIGIAWPNQAMALRELVAGVEEVLVIEDKTAFVESQLKEALYRQPHQPVI
ncbi:MAG: indolepyruvate ferredoxin oxidoreductase family protein, partial [Acidimicrobiales bacterium]